MGEWLGTILLNSELGYILLNTNRKIFMVSPTAQVDLPYRYAGFCLVEERI